MNTMASFFMILSVTLLPRLSHIRQPLHIGPVEHRHRLRLGRIRRYVCIGGTLLEVWHIKGIRTNRHRIKTTNGWHVGSSCRKNSPWHSHACRCEGLRCRGSPFFEELAVRIIVFVAVTALCELILL